MRKHEAYSGIDLFRLAAAILVIAIHTSPLSSYSVLGNFLLTRVVARIAVPFFFVTSGFFLFPECIGHVSKLKKFIKSTAQIYGVAILLCLPLNIYNGYFNKSNLLPKILKDLVFDGTFYHLWYLPATILGALIARQLLKTLRFPKAFAAAGLLYAVGLLGDSYHGFAQMISGVSTLFSLIFQVSDYTRNGIFFAPIFFLLGAWISGQPREKRSPKTSVPALLVSFFLMAGEALTVRRLGWQRFDCMYLFLPPTVFFLFQTLLRFRGKRRRIVRTTSLFLYILHPLVIVALRFAARFLGLWNLLVNNSLTHFTAVCLLSLAFAFPAAILSDKIGAQKKEHCPEKDRAWIEIDLNNLESNAQTLRRLLPDGCRLTAVVKAGAYGHGAFEICTRLRQIGVKSFAVATIDEGIALRSYGICGEILILGPTDVCRAAELKKHGLMQSLVSPEYAEALDKQGIKIKTHLKIDTGMHRLGFACPRLPSDFASPERTPSGNQPAEESNSEDFQKISEVFKMKHLQICGMYTHLCRADSTLPEDAAFTNAQINRFFGLIDRMKRNGLPVPKTHIQNSGGLLNYPHVRCDRVRIGAALYGIQNAPSNAPLSSPDLRPVLSLKARVVLIRSLPAGESFGYGKSFTAARDSRIALLSIGYGDGIPRSLSRGKGSVLIGGQRLPIVGDICMDLLAVDATDAIGVSVGDTATLLGRCGTQELSAANMAQSTGSIANELLCRLGTRLPVTIASDNSTL